MSEQDSDKIEPVDFNLSESPLFSNQTAQVSSNKPKIWVWMGLSGLVLVALLVIFVLPTVVSKYELPLERRVDVAEILSNQALVNPVTAISPFAEAQQSLLRKEAQDVLAELLGRQSELDALDVQKWAEVAYAEALEQASIGDEYYRTQAFALARDSYALGRAGLDQLFDSVATVLSQTLIDAQQALEESDAIVARDKFALALLFEADNEIAQIGLQRAQSLDEVGAFIADANELFEDGELDQARDLYRQVLNLDSYNQFAREKIREVSALIIGNEFSRIMSSGYTLLEGGDPEHAIATFQRAAALGVKQEQALAAITQTENEIASAEINRLRELIVASEGEEQWQSAVGDYDRVLAIDVNLLFAIDGRDYAEKRARLDSLLIDAIDNPERFSEDAVFQQTLDVYYTGRAIEEVGPRLSGQLDELQIFLENSQVPIDVQLISDALTDVTLLRIGNLGTFKQTSVSLKPGHYVAVGKRIGYREVRAEFTVGFGQTPNSVLVKCEERIVATNRR